MSRLDRHISVVRGKLMLGQFLKGLAWSALAVAAIVWTAVMVDRLLQLHLPHQGWLFLICIGVGTLAAWGFALWRRPSAQRAAVVIDEKLQLKEKFSSALYVRPLNDPFALAVVRDAEQTADNVSLHKRFPVVIPQRPLAGAGGMACVALLTFWLLPSFDLFHVQANRQKKIELAHHERVAAQNSVKQALVQLDNAPKQVADSQAIKLARNELAEALKNPGADPKVTQQKAQDALNQLDAVKAKIKDAEKFAEAKNEMRALESLPNSPQDTGPIAEARSALSKGDLSDAVEELKQAVDNFDKKTPEEQKKTADDMAKLAAQIQQQANNPQVQQNIQQQLQKMGMNQQQAQAMAQQMQAAANGDKAAQQQVQNAANKLAQQMNAKNPGSTPAQQQQVAAQMSQAMAQLQSQANGQAQSQQLAQSASALAQAMSQSANAQQQQQSPGKPGQQGSNGQSAQANAQQQKTQAGQAMQQQMQQMQQMANAAQSGAAGQQGNNPGQNGQQGQQGQGQNPGQPGHGQWAAGNPQNQQGQGDGNPGQASGARPGPQEAPFGVKQELSESQTDEKGKVLASSFVKAGTVVGESKAGLSNAVLQEKQDAADQVDEDRIPRASAQAVKNYFQTLKDDSK
jgi:hypothetical protein